MTSADSNPLIGQLPFLGVTTWRLLVNAPLSGAANMAIDEVLMHRAAESGEGVFRIYHWNQPTLSLGRHQRAREAFDPQRADSLGVHLVRRMTGGRALLHWHEVTYSVTAPIGGEPLHESYAAINALLLDALGVLGVDAQIAPRSGRMPPPGSAPCFELPAEGEILVGAHKLVGSAQLRDSRSMLQHGSVLIADDQALVGRVSPKPVTLVAPAATLAQALGRVPTFEEVAAALQHAFVHRLQAPPASLEMDAIASAVEPLIAKYDSDSWNWSR
ncbi:MAG: lipoate--protein ligase family protein [Gemmatimonadaceae bacterium]